MANEWLNADSVVDTSWAADDALVEDTFGDAPVAEQVQTGLAGAAAAPRPQVPLPQTDIAAPPPVGEEGFLGGLAEAGRSFVRGAQVALPEHLGSAAEYAGRKTGLTGLEQFGVETQEDAEEWLRQNPEYQMSQLAQQRKAEDPFSVRGSVGEAAEMLVPSVAAPVAGAGVGAALGAGIGALAGGVGAIPGAAIGAKAGAVVGQLAGLATFFGAAASETEEKVEKAQLAKGMSPERAKKIAEVAGYKSGAIEAGGELISSLPFLKILRILPDKAAKDAVQAATNTLKSPGSMLTDLLKVMGAEVGTELAQAAGQQYVEAEAGAGELPTWDSTKGVIMPTMIMSAMTWGLAEPMGAAQRNALAKTLTNKNAKVADRMRAVNTVAQSIRDPDIQNLWVAHATRQVEAKAPVVLDKDVFYVDEMAKRAADFNEAAAAGRAAPPAPEAPATAAAAAPLPEAVVEEVPAAVEDVTVAGPAPVAEAAPGITVQETPATVEDVTVEGPAPARPDTAPPVVEDVVLETPRTEEQAQRAEAELGEAFQRETEAERAFRGREAREEAAEAKAAAEKERHLKAAPAKPKPAPAKPTAISAAMEKAKAEADTFSVKQDAKTGMLVVRGDMAKLKKVLGDAGVSAAYGKNTARVGKIQAAKAREVLQDAGKIREDQRQVRAQRRQFSRVQDKGRQDREQPAPQVRSKADEAALGEIRQAVGRRAIDPLVEKGTVVFVPESKAPKGVQGWHQGGKIHIVTGKRTKATEGLAAAVLSHEETHRSEERTGPTDVGLRGVLGRNFDSVYKQVMGALAAGDPVAQAAVARATGTERQDLKSEHVAYFVETAMQRLQAKEKVSGSVRTALNRIKAAVKAWLATTAIGKQMRFELTDEFVAALVSQSLRRTPEGRAGISPPKKGSIEDDTATTRTAQPNSNLMQDQIRYSIRHFADGTDVDAPGITSAMLNDEPISREAFAEYRRNAKEAGIDPASVDKAVKKFQNYNKIRRIGNYTVMPKIGTNTETVVVREGVLNTPAIEGRRRERLDKYYDDVTTGELYSETGALFEGARERSGIPKGIRGLQPDVFLNVPITQPELQQPRPVDLKPYPLVVTGNPHIQNFKRPHKSWDDSIKVVRIKPVHNGNDRVTQSVADAISYANEIDAKILVTTFRAKQPWVLAKFTNFLPNKASDPDFDTYWKPNPNPKPEDRKKLPDWMPYVPRGKKVAEAFRKNGWDIEKNLYGTGGTWWWPQTREIDDAVKKKVQRDFDVEYCDMLHKGCTACRNCQKLTYPKSAGAQIVGVTDEPFCEHGCPQCFVRMGQSGVKGRKGISVGQNAKQAGFGQADLGDRYERTVPILQKVVRPSDSGKVNYVSKFMSEPPSGQIDMAASLLTDGSINMTEFNTIQEEILDTTGEVSLQQAPDVPVVEVPISEIAMPGEKKQFSFIGSSAKTINVARVAELAYNINTGRTTAEEVRKNTGWFRGGVDKRWRYELDDSQLEIDYVKLTDSSLDEQDIWLSDIMDHPQLMAAYPWAARIRVKPDDRKPNGNGGGVWSVNEAAWLRGSMSDFEQEPGTIYVDRGLFDLVTALRPPQPRARTKKNTAILRSRLRQADRAAREIARIRRKGLTDSEIADMDRRLNEKLDDPWTFAHEVYSTKENVKQDEFRALLLHEIQHAIQDYEGYTNGIGPAAFEGLYTTDEAMNLYFNAPGEVEARDTAARRNLTAEEREDMLPRLDEARFKAGVPDTALIHGVGMAPVRGRRVFDRTYTKPIDEDLRRYAGDRVRYSRAAPPGFEDLSQLDQDLIADTLPDDTVKGSLRNMIHKLTANAGARVNQGVFDRFWSLRKLGLENWKLAHLIPSASGAVEGMLDYAPIMIDSEGVLAPKLSAAERARREAPNRGLIKTLGQLGPEVDRFFLWVAANRAEAINARADAAQRRAHTLTQQMAQLRSRITKLTNQGGRAKAVRNARALLAEMDAKRKDAQKRAAIREKFISGRRLKVLKTLNRGRHPDGPRRRDLYDQVWRQFQAFNNSVLDVAVSTGLIPAAQREQWRDEFYVPFYRIMDEETSAQGPKTANQIVRQKAFEQYRGSERKIGDLLGNTLMNWNHLLSASLRNQAGVKALAAAEAAGVAHRTTAKNKSGKAVYVNVNGKQRWYEVDDPMILDSLTMLNMEGMNTSAMRAARSVKRLFTELTTATPAFLIANVMRDAIMAPSTNRMSRNVLNNVMDGYKATDKKTLIRAMMLTGGGEIHFGHTLGTDPDATKRLIKKHINPAHTLNNDAGWKNFFSAAKRGWGWWQESGSRVENINRAAVYMDTMRRTGSSLESSFAARDVIDFNRHGSWKAVRVLIDTVAFLNARLQGTHKLGRAAGGGKEMWMKQILPVAGTYMLAGLALYLYNMADDDDDKFKDVEEWRKDAYHLIRIPGTDTIFNLPKPFEIGAVETVAERIAEQIINDEVHGKVFLARMLHLLDNTLSLDPRPQILKPMLEVAANKDGFTGRPIETAGLEHASPTERKKAWTSTVAVGMSELLSNVPWERVQLSPVQVDHMIRGYLGAVGASVAQYADYLVFDPMLDKPTDPEWRVQQYPVIGRFLHTGPNRNTKYGERFYDQLTELRHMYTDIRQAQAGQEYEKARELMQKHRKKLGTRTAFGAADRQIRDLRKRARLVAQSDRSREQKRIMTENIYSQINAIQKKVVTAAERLTQ